MKDKIWFWLILLIALPGTTASYAATGTSDRIVTYQVQTTETQYVIDTWTRGAKYRLEFPALGIATISDGTNNFILNTQKHLFLDNGPASSPGSLAEMARSSLSANGTGNFLGYVCDVYAEMDGDDQAKSSLWIIQGKDVVLKLESSEGTRIIATKVSLTSPEDSIFQIPANYSQVSSSQELSDNITDLLGSIFSVSILAAGK
jgi:hypothetical protein